MGLRALALRIVFILGAFSSVFAEEAPSYLKSFPREAYHKLVSEKQVVGKTIFTWGMEPTGQLRFTETSEMKLTLFRKLQTISTLVDVKTNAKMEIQDLKFSMRSLEATIDIEGMRVGSSIRLKVTQAGRTQTKEIPLEEPVLVSATIRPYLLMKGLPASQSRLEAKLLEPSALATVPSVFTLKKKGDDRWDLNIQYLSQSLSSEISSKGGLIREKSDFAGMQVEGLPVSKEELAKLDITGSKNDLVEVARVPFPDIQKPQELKKFEVKISGIQIGDFQLNRHRQTLSKDKLAVTVETKPADKTVAVQSIVGNPSFSKYLEGDTAIPVYDPIIQKQAREIVGTESDLWKRAKLVHDFVYKNLEKIPTISVPNALEVLQTKRGDCNEHAVLYTALARAAGVPARTVVGLVYSDRFYGKPGFYYHAWVEVFTGKDWLALDPTWNQVPADATHLAFVEGSLDQQVKVTSLMGKIRLSPAKP